VIPAQLYGSESRILKKKSDIKVRTEVKFIRGVKKVYKIRENIMVIWFLATTSD
jgi:hypothetical protein